MTQPADGDGIRGRGVSGVECMQMAEEGVACDDAAERGDAARAGLDQDLRETVVGGRGVST